MKKSKVESIAEYIRVLIARSDNRQIQIQRAELADAFVCAPSQVSYVLGTRFREEDGYYTESQRGSRGYIRITQIKPGPIPKVNHQQLLELLDKLYQIRSPHQSEAEMLKCLVLTVIDSLPPECREKAEKDMATILRQFLSNTLKGNDLR